MSSVDETLRERGARYGVFTDHARITQALKSVAHATANWRAEMTASEREAVEMILHKLGRILNGSPHYRDNWIDIAGYAQLVAEECEA